MQSTISWESMTKSSCASCATMCDWTSWYHRSAISSVVISSNKARANCAGPLPPSPHENPSGLWFLTRKLRSGRTSLPPIHTCFVSQYPRISITPSQHSPAPAWTRTMIARPTLFVNRTIALATSIKKPDQPCDRACCPCLSDRCGKRRPRTALWPAMLHQSRTSFQILPCGWCFVIVLP
jgi:hypothetical protein